MAKTASNASGDRRPQRPANTTKRRRAGPRWSPLDAALRRAGMLHELPTLDPEATDDIPPVPVRGEPVSATLIRERR